MRPALHQSDGRQLVGVVSPVVKDLLLHPRLSRADGYRQVIPRRPISANTQQKSKLEALSFDYLRGAPVPRPIQVFLRLSRTNPIVQSA